MIYDFENRLRFLELGLEDSEKLKKDIEDFFVLNRPIHDCVIDCGNGDAIVCGISRKTGFPLRFFRNSAGSFYKNEPLFCNDEWDIPIIRKFTSIWMNHIEYLKPAAQ